MLDVLTNNYIDGQNACYFAYVPTSATDGYAYLVNDTGNGNVTGSPMLLPSAGTLSNLQCALAVGGSASTSGNTLRLNLNMSFLFGGNRIFYLAARNSGVGDSGWQAGGSFLIQ